MYSEYKYILKVIWILIFLSDGVLSSETSVQSEAASTTLMQDSIIKGGHQASAAALKWKITPQID